MLKFYGIRFNQQGAPERFTLSFAISESLHVGLYMYDSIEGDQDRIVEVIDQEIEKRFQESGTEKSNRQFRFMIAKWFRTKDIMQFVFRDKSTQRLKLNIARILDSKESIEAKWQSIEPLLLDYVDTLPPEDRNRRLSDQESEINLILQMVTLFFLEQDDEVPPANLEMQFIRYQFPKIIWKKKDGFNASSNPFWLPKNMYCRVSFLLAKIISKLYERAESVIEEKSTELVAFRKEIQHSSFSYSALYPGLQPDEIRLELKEEETSDYQLSLLPETAFESLLSIQKLIQRKFSHDGVRHFLGIIRQLASCFVDGACEFDTLAHLDLVGRKSKEGSFSKKQVDLFRGVYDILKQIVVKRVWKDENGEKKTSNPFILELCKEVSSQDYRCWKHKLMLDPIFRPTAHNPFRLGTHLRFVPSALFQESIYKHALLPGLASYLTGTWLNEYAVNKGKTRKTMREIIEGCAFNITPANKYRIVGKVKSELAYMKEKCYLEEYGCEKDPQGNPWDDLHVLTAPETVLAQIAEDMRVVTANCISEKLIA